MYYVVRCRFDGIIITTKPERHDIVWKRLFTPENGIDKKVIEKIKMYTHMKGTENFKAVVQKYLQERAESDSLFAFTLEKPNKNIDDCIAYILNTVQKSGCNGFSDDEVYNMAVHYYDEDNIEVGKPITNVTVVTNNHVELTEDDIKKAKDEAIKKVTDEQIKLLKMPKTKPKPQPQKTEVRQASLFDQL